MNDRAPERADETLKPSALLGLLLTGLFGVALFVVLWAVTNFAFGTLLDGPIGAAILETPCQRLANSTEPLKRYTLGTGRRPSASVCHFASGALPVAGPTDGLGFTGREFVYIATGFAGYALCFVGALVLTFFSVRVARRFFVSTLKRVRP